MNNSVDEKNGTVDLLSCALSSAKISEGLTLAVRGEEAFWNSVIALAQKGFVDQQAQSCPVERCAPAIVSVNATAERASRGLKARNCGLASFGLPSIQRITYAEAYV
ncbi:hypothetical protein [Pseudovibrio axinellae]|uniref:hypothetical protein n=1 Tax=Pseudovibrio axinellae TaxID=989403 RepID=UPI0011140796|nr:hypothetical protein [Pseudovibrio axinellae]